MKVSELTGALLDYWVARTEGLNPAAVMVGDRRVFAVDHGKGFEVRMYSTDWGQGGSLIDHYKMYVEWDAEGYWLACTSLSAYFEGETALEAVCRAVVSQTYGDEVEEPA